MRKKNTFNHGNYQHHLSQLYSSAAGHRNKSLVVGKHRDMSRYTKRKNSPADVYWATYFLFENSQQEHFFSD
jgi:hypothetical protein